MELSLHYLGSEGASVAPEVAKLESKIFGKNECMSQSDLERQLAAQRNIVFLAKSLQRHVIGYILCSASSGNLHVTRLGVLTPYRRQHVAQGLLMVG